MRRRGQKEGIGQKAVSLFLGPTITKAQWSGSKERRRGANELIRTSSALPDR